MLVAEFLPLCRLPPEPFLSRGRGAARLHHLPKLLRSVCPTSDDQDIAYNLEFEVAVAKPVDLDQVRKRVPAVCGACDPSDWLLGNRL